MASPSVADRYIASEASANCNGSLRAAQVRRARPPITHVTTMA
jgi:hypothetical protein